MFCLTQDDDGHWYVIPATHVGRFSRWCESESAASGGNPPKWAVRVNGSPSLVQFKEFVIG